MSGDPPPKTLATVVPRFYVALPQTGPADVTLSEGNAPVQRKFLADLILLYAFDVGTHFEIVAHRDLERLGVTEEELHTQAIENLRDLELKVEVRQGERLMMLTAGGNFEATLLLLPEVWEAVTGMVQGNLIAAVPARDTLFITGDAVPQNIAELRHVTSRMLEQADKPLSRAFVRWDGETWEEYTGFGE